MASGDAPEDPRRLSPIATLLLPFAPPTSSSLGDSGWAVAAAMTVLAFAYSVRLLRWPTRVSADELLALTYVAVATIATLMWLSGDTAS